MSVGRHGEVVTAVKDVVGLALWLVSINTLFHHSEKCRHPWELLSILTPGFLAADHLTVLDQPLQGSDLQTLFLVDPLGSLRILHQTHITKHGVVDGFWKMLKP